MTRPRLPLLATILAATDMALGIVYVLEPRTRLTSPALATAKELWPMWVWGVLILLAGLVAVLAIGWAHHPTVMMSIGAGWHFFFTTSLFWSVVRDEHANAAGVPIFLSFTVLHLLAARQR